MGMQEQTQTVALVINHMKRLYDINENEAREALDDLGYDANVEIFSARDMETLWPDVEQYFEWETE